MPRAPKAAARAVPASVEAMALQARGAEGCFVALDFETADPGADSACALGLVRVENLAVVARTTFLLRPPRPRIMYTSIHGITWPMVALAPTFADAWPSIAEFVAGARFLAAHNAPFDAGVLRACCAAAGLAPPEQPFLCTVRLARRTWNIRPTRLPNVCDYLKLPLRHHDAGSDAEACAGIVVAAARALSGDAPSALDPSAASP